MALGEGIIKMLSKKYESSAMIEKKFKGYDIAFKTDDEGNPIVLFIGKKAENGMIRGQRYARRLLKDKDGKVVKDHWDDKGRI